MANAFSTNLQSQILSVDLNLKQRNRETRPVKCFQFKGTLNGFLEFSREAMKEPSSAGRDFKTYIRQREDRGGEWTGLGNQSAESVIETGRIDSAIDAFKLAESEFKTAFVRGGFKLSPVGSSFDIGRFMRGEPICAYTRPKVKLPILNINLGLAASWTTEASEIARSLVKIAKAAWQYQLAGGIVKITVHYSCMFTRPNNGHGAAVISLDCPLANMGMFAGSLSVQFFRALYLPFAKALSGDYDDSLPAAHYQAPGLFNLSGKRTDDDKILAALKIPGGAS